MAQLNDTMVQGDLRVTGSIYGNLGNALPVAQGGTSATTRLGALKNLTDENVGTSAQYFLTITTNWTKGGYTSVADAKTVLGLGSAAYLNTGTQAGTVATGNHNHDSVYFKSSGNVTLVAGSATKIGTQNGSDVKLTLPSAYSLPLAASGTRGGIQIGYSESGTNYAVKLSSEKAYVTVPWTDTKVTQTVDTSSNAAYPLLAKNTTATATITDTSRFTSGVTLNPKNKSITATTFIGALSGNATSANTALAVANTTGSGGQTQSVAANLDGFTTAFGVSGTSGYLLSSLSPNRLSLSGQGGSSTYDTTTITSNTASLGGSLSVSGSTACDGGLGVKTGFTMLNSSNTAVATIANNGNITTSGTVNATGNMSTSGTLTVTGAITGSSDISTKGNIFVTNAAGTVATAVLNSDGTITASGNITSASGGVYANSGSIEGKYGKFANYLMACERYADGTATVNAGTTITWPKGDTDLLLVQNGTSKVTIDMVNLLQGKVYWLHSGRAREVELTASLSGWTIYIYDTAYSSLTSGAKIPLQDNIKSTMHHGQFSVAIIRTAEKTFYAIMSYGETSKEHEYGYNHYTTSMAYSDKAYTFYRIASFNLPDVGVTECLLTLRLSFILTYVQFGYMPTDYTDIEVVLGVRQENTTSYQTWVSRRQTYIKGTSTQINNAKISVGTYSDNGKTKIYIALVVPAHTSVYSRYLADFAYYASAGVLEYNSAAYTSTTPSGYTEKDSTAIQ